jgi:hypothetical protein
MIFVDVPIKKKIVFIWFFGVFHLVVRQGGFQKTNLLFPENIKKDAVHLQRYFECIYVSGIIIFPNDALITLIR